MNEISLEEWLKDQGYNANTVRQMLNRVQRLRVGFGDLECLHASGQLAAVHEALRYTTNDERAGRSNSTPIPISGNLRTGLSVYASTLRALSRYLDWRRESGHPGQLSVVSEIGAFSSADAELTNDGVNAANIVAQGAAAAGLDIPTLIAQTAWWVPPSAYAKLAAADATVWFPEWRRAQAGELIGRRYDGLFVDDGQKADLALRLALFGRLSVTGFSTTHVWSDSEHDPSLYTELANLVLLPTPVAALVTLLPEHRRLLQWRAYEVYGWRPEGRPLPETPGSRPLKGWRTFSLRALGRLEIQKRLSLASSDG